MASTSGTQVSRPSVGSLNRKLRYRGLLENCAELIEDENGDNMKIMDKTWKVVCDAKNLLENGKIEERIEHPSEGYLDSRVLRATSDLTIRCSHAVSSNANTYDRHELATHIREHPESWKVMFPREAPASAFLYGTFDPAPPEERPRVIRRRVERQRAAPMRAPAKVDRLHKQEEGSEMVDHVNFIIHQVYQARGEPISYFHLVLDPESFSRSVENIYNVSFLVRDAKLKVDLDEQTDLPFITPVDPADKARNSTNVENQFIVSLDMKRWKDLIEAFNIREAMIVLESSSDRL